MNVTLFVTLLTIYSGLTALGTEAFKKIFDSLNVNYSSNILALIIAMIIGIGGTADYFIVNNISFTLENVLFMLLIGIASAVGAMVGYDKVIQTIKQID
jgi:Na+-driven multidrug efflux pump